MSTKVINLFGDKTVPNTGVKYSELLEQFMAKYKNDFSNIEFIEDVFDFAILAWNFGNMKVIVPNDEFKKIISTAPNIDIDFSLLKKMIDYKFKKFKEYTNFIVDYELKESDKDPILSVITQEEETYLAAVFENLEEQDTQDDFKENYINRSAVILKPLQPFLDWLNHLYPDDEMDDGNEVNIYLVSEEIDDVEVWLKKKFDTFFMMELNDWHTNKKEWPQRRNYKMFKQWFNIEISTMIYDLEKKPVFKSE